MKDAESFGGKLLTQTWHSDSSAGVLPFKTFHFTHDYDIHNMFNGVNTANTTSRDIDYEADAKIVAVLTSTASHVFVFSFEERYNRGRRIEYESLLDYVMGFRCWNTVEVYGRSYPDGVRGFLDPPGE